MLEEPNDEIKCRPEVVGIFPNELAILGLVGALLREQNDEYAIQKRSTGLEPMAPLPSHRRHASHPHRELLQHHQVQQQPEAESPTTRRPVG